MSMTFQGAPKFLAAQLDQDWGYVKNNRPASLRERTAQIECTGLLNEYPYLKGLHQLRHYYDLLGIKRLREIANEHDKRHLFGKACRKACDLPK